MAATTDEKATIQQSSDTSDNDSIVLDMTLLLDCLKFQTESVPLQKQALATLASMCQEKAESRDLFRTSGCLEYITSLLSTTSSNEVLQAGLYALASCTENNVVSQMKLSNKDTFNLITKALTHDSPVLLQSSAIFLAITLMYNNSQGQNNARETKLVHKLVDLFKCGLLVEKIATNENNEVWLNVAQAVSVSCDNPQNELNQRICCSVIPAAISILNTDGTPHSVIKAAITVIISCVFNNVTTQNKLNMVGGLKALGKLIHMLSSSSAPDCLLLLHTARCVCAASAGNDASIESVSSMRIIPALLNALKLFQNTESLLTLVLCIETLVENNSSNQQQLLDSEGVPLLISIMANNTEDSTLNKVITVLLQSCTIKKSTEDINDIRNTLNQIIKLTDVGLAKLTTNQSPIVLPTAETTDTHDKPSSPTLHLDLSLCERPRVIQPSTSGITNTTDTALKQLPSNNLTMADRVQDWLEQNKVDTVQTNHHENNVMPTSTEIIPLHTGVPDPLPNDNTTNNKQDHVTQQSINEGCLQNSFASESQIIELRSSLTKEQEKRMKMEKRLKQLETVIAEKASPITIKQKLSKNSSRNNKVSSNDSMCSSLQSNNKQSLPQQVASPQSICHSQRSKPNVRVTPSRLPAAITRSSIVLPHSRSPAASLASINSDAVSFTTDHSTNNMCIGCFGLPGGELLTSRNLIPHLTTDPNTCRYHRKVMSSICDGGSLVVSCPQHLRPSSNHGKSRRQRLPMVNRSHHQPRHTSTPVRFPLIQARKHVFKPSLPMTPSTQPVVTSTSTKEPSITMQKVTSSSLQNDHQHMSSIPSSIPQPSSSAVLLATSTVLNQQGAIVPNPSYTMTPPTPLSLPPPLSPITSIACTSHKVRIDNNRAKSKKGKCKDTVPALKQAMTKQGEIRKPLADCTNNTSVCSSDVYEYTSPLATKDRNRQENWQYTTEVININKPQPRRPPLPFTKEEEKFLASGVKKMGNRWKHILSSYPFREGRTATSLKDKYRLLQMKSHQ